MNTMPAAFALLLAMQLVGEVLRRVLHLPLPGPVIGMFLLTLLLVTAGRGWIQPKTEGTAPLPQLSQALITNMGLLFVPAGVGIITEMDVLKQAWLPILAGLFVSTILGLAVTALVMHALSRGSSASESPALDPPETSS
jgi:holin-like protein